ncbi:MAG: ATP-binding protein [Promethearchaeota archaeon]
MSKRRIPQRVSAIILKSLNAGVVPRIGLEHIAVGRKEEIESLLEDLENIEVGSAAFRFFIGRYGSGKSFLIQLLRNYAMDRDFVVADVDLSPARRFIGSGSKGVATYRELITNMSTKTRPSGGALTAILEKWISKIQSMVITEKGIKPGDPVFVDLVETEIINAVNNIKDLVHGFDFAIVISTYWRGHKLGEEETKENALRWLRGEYTTKTEARNALGVNIIVDDDSWYDYIKLLARFVTEIGYKGLLVFFDEAVNLYKITHTQSRTNNYEKLLTMYNDTMQGKAEYLGIFVGGTPQFLEDRRRGLYSYEALHSRLVGSRFTKNGLRDISGPIIKLERLTLEEIFVLLTRVMNIHALHYKYNPFLSNDELQEFIKVIVSRIGADKLLTPREFVREFIILLNILRKNPEQSFLGIIQGEDFKPQAPSQIDESVKGTEFEEFKL